MAEASKRYRQRHPDRVAEAGKRYRETHRDRVAEYHKCYREKHRAQLAERRKRYREIHREQVLAYQQRYREAHRELLREKERRRPARLRETHPELLREKDRRRQARLREKKRTAEKLKALGPLTLTIPLTDCLKSGHIPVTAYVKAFCDSLESVDTNVSPAENGSHTLINLDSGAIEVREPPDCDLDDLSSLQNISPDEWAELLEDVEDSSFDVESLVPPQSIIDLLEDMSSCDEGIDLLYDLVS